VGPLNGFVTIPRPAETLRPTGVFFSAVVVSKVGPQTWRVNLDGRNVVVSTTLDLAPGQTLRLKWVSQQGDRWLLQTWPQSAKETLVSPGVEANALMAAFLSRGLPLAAEKLTAWTRWLEKSPGPVDKENWAASLEARGQGPFGPFSEGLDPWLAWQSSLEQGKNQPPPDDDYWDLWNSRNTSSGDPWLVTKLVWVHEDQEDAGLLQAHWNPQAQCIDQWNLTACPADTPFRLEARSKPQLLDLTWCFFHEKDRALWEPMVPGLLAALSSEELTVHLRLAGPPEREKSMPLGSVDVEA